MTDEDLVENYLYKWIQKELNWSLWNYCPYPRDDDRNSMSSKNLFIPFARKEIDSNDLSFSSLQKLKEFLNASDLILDPHFMRYRSIEDYNSAEEINECTFCSIQVENWNLNNLKEYVNIHQKELDNMDN